MSDIQRYDILLRYKNGVNLFSSMEELDLGQYIKYDDHLKTIEAKDKENKALMDGIENQQEKVDELIKLNIPGSGHFLGEMKIELNNLLSSNTPVDKSTGIVSKEWSDWYLYVGEVDFKDEVTTFWGKERMTASGNILNELKPKRYRIKLNGVKVDKYETEDIFKRMLKAHKVGMITNYEMLGNDPHNKIIIIKDESTINQKE